MKIKLMVVGKTDDKNIQNLVSAYLERLTHYINFEFYVIPDVKNAKNLTNNQQKLSEGQLILKQLQASDLLILFDENGTSYSSKIFSEYLQKKMLTGCKQLVFVIGGPYGFSEEVYQKAVAKIALSKMTFSHQMARLFAVEQFYRAFTIINNEPYHHQ